MIGLGFVSTRDEVKSLIDRVDKDGNGDIDPNEFLLVMLSMKKVDKGLEEEANNSSLYEFFHLLKDNKLSDMEYMDKELSFNLNVSQSRRKKILGKNYLSYYTDAIMSNNEEKRKNGARIMNVNFLYDYKEL